MTVKITIEVPDVATARFAVGHVEECAALDNFPLDPQSVQTFVEGGGTFINGYGDAVVTIKVE